MNKTAKMSKKKKLPHELLSEEQLREALGQAENYDFKNREDFLAFLGQFVGQTVEEIRSFSPQKTPKEEARELAEEAYWVSDAEAEKLIKKALSLDPDNVEAHLYLAGNTADFVKAISLYEKTIELAKKELGEEFFKQSEGHFWLIPETRPYMRAMSGMANWWLEKGKYRKAIDIYLEMIRLNPNDNQGVRYILSNLYLRVGDLGAFRKFSKHFEDGASVGWLFDNALYHFMLGGDTELSREKLKEADAENPYLIDFMTGRKQIPDDVGSSYVLGDESEAVHYLMLGYETWVETPGALAWIDDFRLGQGK